MAEGAVAGLDGSTVCLELSANFIEESFVPVSLLPSVDIVCSTTLALLHLLSDIEATTIVFAWVPVFTGFMFVEDGD